MNDETLKSCKNCKKKFKFILKHIIPGACKSLYTKEEIAQLKKAARKITITKNNEKRRVNYDQTKRRQQYINKKSKSKQDVLMKIFGKQSTNIKTR